MAEQITGAEPERALFEAIRAGAQAATAKALARAEAEAEETLANHADRYEARRRVELLRALAADYAEMKYQPPGPSGSESA